MLFDAEIDGLKEAKELTVSIAVNAGNINEFLATRGKKLLKKQSKLFWSDQQGPWAGPWDTTLIDTTALINDLQDDMNYLVNGFTLEQMTTLVYGPVHFFGLKVKGHQFQERPFGGLNDEGISELQDEAIDFIYNGK